MQHADVAKVLHLPQVNTLTRLRARAGIGEPVGQGYKYHFSPGDVLAMHVVNEIDGVGCGFESKWAEGARKCGEALDNGYRPAFLVTRGQTENLVVLESDDPHDTDEMVGAVLMQASDAGAAVKVVRLRPIVAALEPWCSELCDA